MSFRAPQPISGHVFRPEGERCPVWYAKYRLPDGRQIQRRIGPAWTMRGRPAEGFHTRRTAQAWLDRVLAEARRGELPGVVRTGATFADAVAEYMRWLELLQPKAWMGHADIDTTMKYLHYAPRDGEADLIADAFAPTSLDPTALRDGA
jgi:hypothetical protein